jgi:hypothetical protein
VTENVPILEKLCFENFGMMEYYLKISIKIFNS